MKKKIFFFIENTFCLLSVVFLSVITALKLADLIYKNFIFEINLWIVLIFFWMMLISVILYVKRKISYTDKIIGEHYAIIEKKDEIIEIKNETIYTLFEILKENNTHINLNNRNN